MYKKIISLLVFNYTNTQNRKVRNSNIFVAYYRAKGLLTKERNRLISSPQYLKGYFILIFLKNLKDFKKLLLKCSIIMKILINLRIKIMI